MRTVTVTFTNGDQITTRINGTIQSICDYYHNNVFNLGHIEDNMQYVTQIEFLY